MRITDTLRAEHHAVLGVLDQLDAAVGAAERGIPIPADVFNDIQEFFAVFVDRCHHGKEEAAVFTRLSRYGDATGVAESLGREHADGRRLAEEFAAIVHAYIPGDPEVGARLAASARAYAVFLKAHIEREDRDLFPAIERDLASEDSQIAAEFDQIEDEEIGVGTHERLHHMIDDLPGRIRPWLVNGTRPD